ncbi:hypothetical protein MSPP1_004074 [Malassezia sp. CBS 17886]|nr:hypothetical protein MSPP1_004074 [Malassezia sp. CBS 17886]
MAAEDTAAVMSRALPAAGHPSSALDAPHALAKSAPLAREPMPRPPPSAASARPRDVELGCAVAGPIGHARPEHAARMPDTAADAHADGSTSAAAARSGSGALHSRSSEQSVAASAPSGRVRHGPQTNHTRSRGVVVAAKKRYPCPFPGCDKTFSTSGHSTRHSRIHTGEKPYHCSYPGCDAQFSRYDNSLQHYRTHIISSKGGKKTRGGRPAASAARRGDADPEAAAALSEAESVRSTTPTTQSASVWAQTDARIDMHTVHVRPMARPGDEPAPLPHFFPDDGDSKTPPLAGDVLRAAPARDADVAHWRVDARHGAPVRLPLMKELSAPALERGASLGAPRRRARDKEDAAARRSARRLPDAHLREDDWASPAREHKRLSSDPGTIYAPNSYTVDAYGGRTTARTAPEWHGAVGVERDMCAPHAPYSSARTSLEANKARALHSGSAGRARLRSAPYRIQKSGSMPALLSLDMSESRSSLSRYSLASLHAPARESRGSHSPRTSMPSPPSVHAPRMDRPRDVRDDRA